MAATVVACAGTGVLPCVVGGAVAAGVTSWGNQALDNAGRPVKQAISRVDWRRVAVDTAVGAVSAPIGNGASRLAGVVTKRIASATVRAITQGSIIGAVSSGTSRAFTNALDGDSQTGLTTGVLEACAVGGVVGRYSSSFRSSGPYLFGGTTRGWPGNPVLQRLKISPASTNPAKATLFAIESDIAAGGGGVVHIATPDDLAGAQYAAPNTHAAIEDEIPVNLHPEDFADRASITIPVEEARNILKGMGIETPPYIYGKSALDQAPKEAPSMSTNQILEFIKCAKGGRP